MRFDEVARAAQAIDAFEKAEANLKIVQTAKRGCWDLELTDRLTLTITLAEMLALLMARRDGAKDELSKLGVELPPVMDGERRAA